MLSTLQHEGFHQFAFLKTDDDLPIWVNEGLAEYFGDAVIVEGGVRHGLVGAGRLDRLKAAHAARTSVPFQALLDMDSETWRQNLTSGSALGGLQYDQSWAAVHFLIHSGPEVERAFTRYLVELSRNVRHTRAFRESFGEDTRRMEAAYHRFLKKLEPDPFGEALGDLRFLAEGVRYLHARDGDVTGDAATLGHQLRSADFTVTTRSHGVVRETRARDPEVFRYTGDAGETASFTLAPPAAEGLPPEVVASALRPPARIVWRRDADGALVSDIHFE